jgi:hypothetical protein
MKKTGRGPELSAPIPRQTILPPNPTVKRFQMAEETQFRFETNRFRAIKLPFD